MRWASLCALALVAAAPAGRADEKAKVALADFIGTWKAGDNSLTINETGLSRMVFRFDATWHAGTFKPELKGDALILEFGSATDRSRWKVTRSGKETLVMEQVEGKQKRDKITLARQPDDKKKPEPKKKGGK